MEDQKPPSVHRPPPSIAASHRRGAPRTEADRRLEPLRDAMVLGKEKPRSTALKADPREESSGTAAWGRRRPPHESDLSQIGCEMKREESRTVLGSEKQIWFPTAAGGRRRPPAREGGGEVLSGGCEGGSDGGADLGLGHGDLVVWVCGTIGTLGGDPNL